MAKICAWRGLLPFWQGGRTSQFQPVLKRGSAIAAAISNNQSNERAKHEAQSAVPVTGVRSPQPATPINKTAECNPVRHSLKHEGMFYNLTNDDVQTYFRKSFRVEYYRQCKAFLENALMIRKPALELMSFLRSADYTHPVIRYILYGEKGNGKTSTLAHVIHYAAYDGWMIMYLPWPGYWNNYFKETSASSYKNGRIDTPQEAVEILADFKRVNKELLEKHGLSTVHRYVWSRREVFEAGTPWLRLLEFGIERPKYSSDLVGALLKEIRVQSARLPFRTLLAVDGVNSFWGTTWLRNEDKSRAKLDQMTLVHNFKKTLRGSWSNGALVLTVDKSAAPLALQNANLPAELLGKDGFEWLDPFVPLAVPSFNLKEAHSCIDYYVDRNWICLPQARTEQGRKELMFLSGRNPLELNKLSALR